MRALGRESGTEAFDRRLIRKLSIALRTAELHERDNAVAEGALIDLFSAVRERLETLGAAAVATRSRHLFVDGERVRLGASDYLHLRYLLGLFDTWELGSITLLPGLTLPELTSLIYSLVRDRRTGLDALNLRLSRERIVHVEINAPTHEILTEECDNLPIRTYGACLDVLDELRSSIVSNRQIRTRRLRRITQSVVDQMLTDEYALLSLTTIKQFDDHLFTHSTNVAILSVALGQRAGLTKTQLGELCLAAFLHDLGKVAVSRDILDKPGSLSDDERLEMNQHPIHSVHILLNQEHLSPSTLRAIVGGFEHHLNYDLTGYPSLTQKSSISLFGRIITIADRYDALTTPRSYRKTNYTPYEGIQHLLAGSGSEFDPVLVKLFVAALGLYPPGAVIGLDDGTLALVVQPPTLDSPLNRPHVRLLTGSEAGRVLDLALRDENGSFGRRVVALHNPGNRGQLPAIDPAMLDDL